MDLFIYSYNFRDNDNTNLDHVEVAEADHV